MKKKYLCIAAVLSVIALSCGALVAKANLEVPEEEAENAKTSIVSLKTNEFLDSLHLDEDITKILEKENELTGNKFYMVETPSTLLKVDSSTHSVTSFSLKQVNCDFKKTANKNKAKEFILGKYEELELPKEYDLVYLEEFDDYCWEADFQKKYDDVYNMYEAVKVFFVPETGEIISLNNFREEYKETKKDTIKESKAIEKAKTVLDEKAKITDTTLTIIKGDKDKALHKAYIVKTADGKYVFVDAFSGDIIGGDEVNE